MCFRTFAFKRTHTSNCPIKIGACRIGAYSAPGRHVRKIRWFVWAPVLWIFFMPIVVSINRCDANISEVMIEPGAKQAWIAPSRVITVPSAIVYRNVSLIFRPITSKFHFWERTHPVRSLQRNVNASPIWMCKPGPPTNFGASKSRQAQIFWRIFFQSTADGQ